MAALLAWVLTFLHAAVPPHHHAWRREPRAVTEARYEAMAKDIVTAALEAPIDGDVPWTALLLAETAVAESALRADVDACLTPGDGGLIPAWTAFGLARPRGHVCKSRLTAARVAREELRRSLEACGTLAFYMSGRCDRGLREARRRWRTAMTWMRDVPLQNGMSSSSSSLSSTKSPARGAGDAGSSCSEK